MLYLGSILPIHEPLLIFTILIGIILLSPFLFRLIGVPDVAAFIIMGVLVGPFGFQILTRDSSIELLGTVGLLYIMFMAGLELDMDKLKLNKKNSFVFGLATFIIPFSMGILMSLYALNLEIQAILLISIMFATHTLVSYPIVRRLGVSKDVSVLTAVGGTIVTDTSVLLMLSIITQDMGNGSAILEVIKLIFLFTIYSILVFYTFPLVARWFFRNIKRDRPVHFLFLLFMVCVSSYLAELIGTEPIIGAFLAGLALNRSIPKNSLLMHHIDFVGNVLFIPVFLIGIGMLINVRTLVSGGYLWYVFVILIVTAFVSKWLAAFVSQKILAFNGTQRNLLFGLTCSHAAATIAIIAIGYEKLIIDIDIFNATILVILVSSILASLITEKAGKKLAMNADRIDKKEHYGRILVPISNPASMVNLIAIANSFQKVNPYEAVYVISIINENKSSRENIKTIKDVLERNVEEFNNLSENLKVVTRVDLSISSGIIRAAKEYMASDIVFGWGGKNTASQKIFGTIFDHLLNSLQTLYAVNVRENLYNYNKFVVHIPANMEYEPMFCSIIEKLNKIPKDGDILIFRTEVDACKQILMSLLPKRNKHIIHYYSTGFNDSSEKNETVHLFFQTRKQSVAYNLANNNAVQKILAKDVFFDFILIVPGFE